jgi:2,4-dienoyl-CoA reductase-like NADH-dependent reductase (Old Yellow Enzyme family)/thioredoxin reductase
VTEFQRLFTPYALGGLELRNRVVWMAHPTGYVDDQGRPTSQYVEYVRARARGGTALIVIGGQSSHPACLRSGRIPAFEARVVPALQQLSAAAHEGGAFIFGQLTDYGSQDSGDGTLEWAHARGPSLTTDQVSNVAARAMDRADIDEAVAYFARAAAIQREGGFDGLELNAGQSSLLRQFLSPASNLRQDAFGGSLENRMRLLRLVVEAARRATGGAFPVGIQLCLDEQLDGGYGPDDAVMIARAIGGWGCVDYLSFSAGIGRPADAGPDMAVPEGYLAVAIGAARRAAGIPVVASGRIQRPETAERLLQDGQTDLVGLTRALIADPRWPARAARGEVADIRPCIACNQACAGRSWQGKPISCIVNPAAGREAEWDSGSPAATPKRVVVVGGGPAGMAAAVSAARRGHQVTLIDKAAGLGGNLRYLLAVESRREFGRALAWWERQLEILHVELLLGREATEEQFVTTPDGFALRLPRVPDQPFDVVIAAAGSRPAQPVAAGSNQPHVLSLWQALDRTWERGSNVVVWDEESSQASASAAEQLAAGGCRVTVVTSTAHPAYSVSPPVAAAHLERLQRAAVDIVPYSRVTAIDANEVLIADIFAGRERRLTGVDAVVYAAGWDSNDELYRNLAARRVPVHRIGDCIAPRDIGLAVYSGEKLALAL